MSPEVVVLLTLGFTCLALSIGVFLLMCLVDAGLDGAHLAMALLAVAAGAFLGLGVARMLSPSTGSEEHRIPNSCPMEHT